MRLAALVIGLNLAITPIAYSAELTPEQQQARAEKIEERQQLRMQKEKQRQFERCMKLMLGKFGAFRSTNVKLKVAEDCRKNNP